MLVGYKSSFHWLTKTVSRLPLAPSQNGVRHRVNRPVESSEGTLTLPPNEHSLLDQLLADPVQLVDAETGDAAQRRERRPSLPFELREASVDDGYHARLS